MCYNKCTIHAWKAPFSAVAAMSCASIGSHFLERMGKTKDEWETVAYMLGVSIMGILTVAETLKVWEQLRLIEE